MAKYASLWSGGKDCCFACHKAMTGGARVSCLVNFAQEGMLRSLSHGIRAETLARQARLAGLPLLQRPVPKGSYEPVFRAAMAELKENGIDGLVTGDIDFSPHREWLERVCRDTGMTLLMPLWNMTPWDIMNGFVDAGFRAIVVAIKDEKLGEEWLGSEMSPTFIGELRRLEAASGFHPCGENGEYHTLVTAGPMFREPLSLAASPQKVTRDGRWFLDV